MKNKLLKKSRVILTIAISVLLLTCVYVSVFAEGIVINYGGTSSDDGGMRIEVGSEITPSAPPPPPTPSIAPPPPTPSIVEAPPAASEAPSSEEVSSRRLIASSDMPPPPSVDSESAYSVDLGLDLSSTVATPSDLFASTAAGGRSIGMSFFAANWWWIVGCAVALLALTIGIIIRRNK